MSSEVTLSSVTRSDNLSGREKEDRFSLIKLFFASYQITYRGWEDVLILRLQW